MKKVTRQQHVVEGGQWDHCAGLGQDGEDRVDQQHVVEVQQG